MEPGKEYENETFAVPITYQEAYRRAEAALRTCQASGTNPFIRQMMVTGNLYSDNETGVLRVNMEGWNNDMERVEISSEGTKSTTVKVSVAGEYWWDKEEIRALRESVETGKVICRPPQYETPKAGNAY